MPVAQGREVAAVSSSAKEAEGAGAEAGDEGRPGWAAAAPAPAPPGAAGLAFAVQDSIIVDLAALPQARGALGLGIRPCVRACPAVAVVARHAGPAGLHNVCMPASQVL